MFTEEKSKEIGQRIKNARKRKGWTQKTLESKCGISTATISRVENGKQVKKEEIDSISKALQINTRSILGLDTVSDNVDDFISLFCKILYSDDNRLEINGVLEPTELIRPIIKNSLVLYISQKLYALFEDVAQAFSDVKDIKDEKIKEQTYKELLQTAKEKYKEKKLNFAKPYFLISEKDLAEIIKKAIDEDKHDKDINDLIKSYLSKEN